MTKWWKMNQINQNCWQKSFCSSRNSISPQSKKISQHLQGLQHRGKLRVKNKIEIWWCHLFLFQDGFPFILPCSCSLLAVGLLAQSSCFGDKMFGMQNVWRMVADDQLYFSVWWTADRHEILNIFLARHNYKQYFGKKKVKATHKILNELFLKVVRILQVSLRKDFMSL